MEILQSNNNRLNKENCNLKNTVQRLQIEKNEGAKSIDGKMQNPVKPYLQMKAETECYKEIK